MEGNISPMRDTFRSRKLSQLKTGAVVAVLLLSLVLRPIVGESIERVRNASDVIRNSYDGRKTHSDKSDVNIFYNGTNRDSGENKSTGEGRICLKEHRVKAREIAEERRRKRKERSNERAKTAGRMEDSTKVGCNACIREVNRSLSLEAIKGSILSKLGMSQPPNLKGRPMPKIGDHRLAALLGRRQSHNGSNGVFWVVQEDELEEMQGDGPYSSGTSEKVISKNSDFNNKSYTVRSQGNASDNRHSDTTTHFQEGEVDMEEEDDYHVRTERIFTFSQPHPRIRHSPHVQHFQFSDKIRNSKVKKAVLWIYIRGRESVKVAGDNITISIYRILNAGEPGSSGSRESPVITSVLTGLNQNVPNGTGAWITLDYVQIRNLVADWFRYPQDNLGIIVTADDANRTNLAVTSHSGNGTAFVPFLEIHVTDGKKHRKKRTIGLNCNDSSNETRCCRYPLTVNFEDFGWDWIIAPKTYEANYCSGTCPFVFLTQYAHTHVMQLADVPGVGPCCAPRKLSAINMLYFDENKNIILGTVPDMVVDRCGCA